MKSLVLKVVFTAVLLTGYLNQLNAAWIETNATGGIKAIAIYGTTILTGTGSGIFRSTNNGVSWSSVNTGLTNLNVMSLAVNGNNIFAGTTGDIFRSADSGISWVAVDSGLPYNWVLALAVCGSNVFAGTNGDGVYKTTNNGVTWASLNNGIYSIIYSFAVTGNYIFAGTGSGVYRSTSTGLSWTPVNTGLPSNMGVAALEIKGGNIFVGKDIYTSNIFISTNNGTSWNAVQSLPRGALLEDFAVSDSILFAGTYGMGVYRTTDNGANWTAFNEGLTNLYVNCIATDTKNIYAGTNGTLFRRSLAEVGVINHNYSRFKMQDNFSISGLSNFSKTVSFNFYLSQAGHVSIKIYDFSGQELSTIASSNFKSGFNTIVWRPMMASGCYAIRIISGTNNYSRKILL